MKSLSSKKVSFSVWIVCGLTLSSFFCGAEINLAAEDTWTYITDMYGIRSFSGGGVVDGKIYVIGGAPNNSSLTSTVEMYDPIAGTWTKMANMPSARGGHATCTLDGKIYVFGGNSPDVWSPGRKNVYVYDPQTDIWTQKSDMPFANAGCGIAVVDGIIYLMGGMLTPSSQPIHTVMAYDPITESWTQKADMPTARSALSCCVVNGKIYAVGGCTENWRTFSYKHVELYDPSTDTWTRKSDMLTERWGLGTCVVDGNIYAIGGWSGSDACTANEVYDPMTDTWTQKTPMQQKRNGAFVCSIGDKIYAMGGAYNRPSPGFLSSAEKYDTGLGVSSPDFNGDGVVDLKDLVILIEYWGTNDTLVDIAPVPFGDGFVDVLDLELLMSYWEQPVEDPTLLAHWALDETEGIIAYDSAGVNDAVVVGGTEWQPNGGKVDGALLLDGIDGCAIAGPVLNPADRPFSVFAWIKGGAPGQGIISQPDGSDWLAVDAEGDLMTELYGLGQSSAPLFSQALIVDEQWHRVGLMWDGSRRMLGVDGVIVAEDTQDGEGVFGSALYIGVGKDYTAGTYFSGLIDDVRIYNRAVKP